MADTSLGTVFTAGLVSFLSPCVLPLVPPYLCYLAGASLDELTAEEQPPGLVMIAVSNALLFVAGFSAVFIALGAAASALGALLRVWSEYLSIAAGIAIILMGLHFLGLFRIPFLQRQMRVEVRPAGPLSSFGMGLAFGFGWTPCIGPILAAIVAVAASEATVARGAGLLAVYSLALGVPFVLAAFAVKPFLGFMLKFRRHMHKVEMAMGVLLVATGIAFLTGSLTTFAYWLRDTFPILGTIG